MKAFEFSYQSILEARRSEEKSSEQAFAAIVARRDAIENELVQNRHYLDSNRHLARSQLTGSIDIEVLRSYAGQSVQVMRHIRTLLVEMSEVHGAMQAAKERWTACRRSRRSIECLRDRAHEKWLRRRRRLEIREQDDLALMRASRELQA